MNLDVNGRGEGVGKGRVVGGRDGMGGEAIVTHETYFGNLYSLNKR